VIAGLSASPTISGETDVDLSFPCPEQVRGINKVYFEGDGADVTINFDLKALGTVAAENTITSLDVMLPEGYDITIENDYSGLQKDIKTLEASQRRGFKELAKVIKNQDYQRFAASI
jgi:hypothetical protein